MRKFSAAAIVAALTGVALLGHAPTASAAVAGTCTDDYKAAAAGYMYAYANVNCDVPLGRALGDDLNWGDSAGSFQGSDKNAASSVLNNGNYSEVKFYLGTGGNNNFHICLLRAEGYASDLTDDYWLGDRTFGSVNNAIASHRWVGRTACSALAV
ncbi:hypothetical protein ACIP3U_14985 [[Kitasatospora] papulosa]|uniref:hypothetical protein n=1 Tax=[Kitasatospora] papulosa TaxID=1464011 RepID=UPI0037F1A6C4